MDQDDWQDLIDAAAERPTQAANEQGSVTNRPLSELQDAKEKAASSTGASNARRGLRLSRFNYPGTTG